MTEITLRRTEREDLARLFEIQKDEKGNWLAAFTNADPTDETAFVDKWERILADPTTNNQTIVVDGTIVGSVAKFEMSGEAEITYWIDRGYWGKGIATQAVRSLLSIEETRPLTARVAFDNIGSQNVLERCGFERIGSDRGFANARQCEIEEVIYRLL